MSHVIESLAARLSAQYFGIWLLGSAVAAGAMCNLGIGIKDDIKPQLAALRMENTTRLAESSLAKVGGKSKKMRRPRDVRLKKASVKSSSCFACLRSNRSGLQVSSGAAAKVPVFSSLLM